MARFLRLALLVVAAVAIAFPEMLVSANPLEVGLEDDNYPTDVSEPPLNEGNSLRVISDDEASARSGYCGGWSPGRCRLFCRSRGFRYSACYATHCHCYH